MLDEPTLRCGIVLRICSGPTCGKRSDRLFAAARDHIRHHELEREVALAHQYCFGRCMLGPNVLIERWEDGEPDTSAIFAVAMGREHPAMRFEGAVTPREIPLIVGRHLAAWRAER